MAGDKIRIGFIGASASYGWGMRSHLPALLALPEYQVAAVCTSRRETAEESAKHYGAGLAFDDYNEMVRHPEIDVVAVCVRAPLHHRMVMAALEAGKHVVCEWPLGANLAEAEEMASLAKSKGVRTMVGLQANGDPALLRLKELVAEGYVGEVLSCSMTMFLTGILIMGKNNPWSADRKQGAHVLTISTGHAMDALCFCLGDFKEVSAHVTTQVRQWETSENGKTVDVTAPDNVAVNGVLTNGVVASFHTSYVPMHGSGCRTEIYGMEGTLVATCPQNIMFGPNRLYGARGKDAALEELPVPDRLTWVPGEVPQGMPFNMAQIYRRFSEAIQGKGDGAPDFDLAVKRHRLIDAIERSADQGVVVQVA